MQRMKRDTSKECMDDGYAADRQDRTDAVERSFEPAVPNLDATIDTRELRDAMGCFATGITIVTARANGQAAGVTANSFCSVSLDPPLVLWCLSKSAPSGPV